MMLNRSKIVLLGTMNRYGIDIEMPGVPSEMAPEYCPDAGTVPVSETLSVALAPAAMVRLVLSSFTVVPEAAIPAEDIGAEAEAASVTEAAPLFVIWIACAAGRTEVARPKLRETGLAVTVALIAAPVLRRPAPTPTTLTG